MFFRFLFIFLLVGCASTIPSDPKMVLDNFSLIGSGQGRIVGQLGRGSFSFYSFFDQKDFIISISIPFSNDETIRITPDEIVTTRYYLDKKYQKTIIDFIDLLRTKDYTCKDQNCTYKGIKFTMSITPKGVVIIQTNNIYAMIDRNRLEIDTTPLKIILVFTR